MSDVLHQLVESAALDLLVLEVAQGIQRKVKDDATLPQLLHKQLLPLLRSCVWRRAAGERRGGGRDACDITTRTKRTFERRQLLNIALGGNVVPRGAPTAGGPLSPQLRVRYQPVDDGGRRAVLLV